MKTYCTITHATTAINCTYVVVKKKPALPVFNIALVTYMISVTFTFCLFSPVVLCCIPESGLNPTNFLRVHLIPSSFSLSSIYLRSIRPQSPGRDLYLSILPSIRLQSLGRDIYLSILRSIRPQSLGRYIYLSILQSIRLQSLGRDIYLSILRYILPHSLGRYIYLSILRSIQPQS